MGDAFSFAAGRGTRRAIYQDRYRDEISERVVAARRALRNLAINAARRRVPALPQPHQHSSFIRGLYH
ncbi:MAG: hypothetical protein A2083_06665 [Gemmatimonadetes bacterium GWC2_71_9]|nr:MAG: hypothetical protein A2083_06665 [Gemmatimonadetes bacterium GWC2_71_9]